MQIFVLTASTAAKKAFASAERSRTYDVVFEAPDRFSSVLKSANTTPDSFFYLDAAGTDTRTLKRRINKLRDTRPYRFGIIDTANAIEDIADLFHSAAADYVGKALAREGITTARLRRIVEYQPVSLEQTSIATEDASPDMNLVPSMGWDQVRDGSEYTFLMLYAGLDGAKELRRKSSEAFLSGLRKTFTALLERSFSEFDAKVWMWLEDEGLLLMPYDGGRIDAIVQAIRLVINRMIYNMEEFAQFGEQSWRLALHLGNTAYRAAGSTGGIVSESVNFVFHLGGQFAERGALVVTKPVADRTPPRVRPLLNHRGSFEGVDIYTLRDQI
jgi:hypothetical protein